MNRRATIAAAVAVVLAVVAGLVLFLNRTISEPVRVVAIDAAVIEPTSIVRQPLEPRSLDAYRGLGTWIDGFDYSPPYAGDGRPPVAPVDVDAMAAMGVETLFMQSGRLDNRSPDVLEDRWLITEFLMRAAGSDIDVVAWFLPKWGEDGADDLAHLVAAHDFDVLGYRFDGIAVDIEWNEDGLDPVERSARLVALTDALRLYVGNDPLGAIVLPPVQTDVLNTTYWPDFPWQQIGSVYDVWLPMSYWSFRTGDYADPWRYNGESVERLRAHLGDREALVHSIGGIGGQIDAPPPGTEPYLARVDQLERFAESVVDTGSIGGSIYDWHTLDQAGRASLRNLFGTGIAAELVDAAPTAGD